MLSGGAERLVCDMLLRMNRLGHDARLCVFNGVDTPLMSLLESNGVKVYKLSAGGSVYNPRLIMRLHRLMRGFDIVHTHNTSPQLFAAVARGWSRKGSRKGSYKGSRPLLVTTEHNTTNRRRGSWLFRQIDRWMYGRYDHIVAITGLTADNLCGHLRRDSLPLTVIENGVDLDAIANAEVSPELQKLAPGCHSILMVAGFRPQKDQPCAIRAIALLPADYHLFFAGQGECLEACRQLAGRTGVADRVHFLGNRSDVPQLFKAADTGLLSSHYEGLALAAVEGMASGCPFVASDVDGLHDVVGGAGCLFEHGNERQLADTVRHLTEDWEFRSGVVRRCQQRAAQYSIDKTVQEYCRLYNSLLK